MSNKTAAVIIASMIGITFVGIGVWLSSRSTQRNPPRVHDAGSSKKPTGSTVTVPKPAKPRLSKISGPKARKQKIPAFRVISDDVKYDTPLRSQVEIIVIMEERVTQKGLRVLINHLYETAKRRGPYQFREQPNYVFIGVHARKGQEWIAKGFKSAVSDFDIMIRKELLKTVNDPPVVRFGFARQRETGTGPPSFPAPWKAPCSGSSTRPESCSIEIAQPALPASISPPPSSGSTPPLP